MSQKTPDHFVEFLPRLTTLRDKARATTDLEERREYGEAGLDAMIDASNADGHAYCAQLLADCVAQGIEPHELIRFYLQWVQEHPPTQESNS